ncbi:MAG TPA: methyl-accepting chemotaxis protein [Paraburkholderia sp.]|uniref:methyl-accepting chemotaxis protein n=1 Tax=Paraburkholderia sp. TaxID=1926495 RepID=UPI002B4A3486|nr:methyl-accepting chemotaxis protein [Paraburkholderia sp.]HKR38301.1 methyl-accepting chemotaxis protein [Paraburkholderia sp.]
MLTAFKNVKIGMRLGASFGLVLMLMAMLIVVGLNQMTNIREINDDIIHKRWVKSDAVQTVNLMTRANARRTMELFITSDRDKTAFIYQEIAANRKTIDEALGTLDRLVASPEGRTMLAQIRESRAAYVASFGKVAQLLTDNRRDEAASAMSSETLPLLDALQEHVSALVDLQKTKVEEAGAQAEREIEAARNWMVGLGVAALVIGIGLAYAITRSITGPLRDAVQIAQTVAAGDLTSRILVQSDDETGQLLQSLKDMNERLKQIVGEVRLGTDTIATASSQIASGNLDLPARTEEQAASLEETAASMEELTGTVRQNADNATQATVLTSTASAIAQRGGEVVGRVVDTMHGISKSSAKVVEIISVIEGIAFQTNILALNAAVEAARAGEQGRGFAVVASEVRTLAQRSAKAAREIKELIGESVSRVETGAKLVEEAGQTIGEVVQSVKRVTDIMSEIASASKEQSTGIEQVNTAVTQMDEVTQQNAALVEEASAAAQAMDQQAQALRQAVSVFKVGDTGSAGASSIATAGGAPAVAAVAKPLSARRAPRLPKETAAAGSSGAVTESDWQTF